jgi:predicted transcriptional regulator
LGKKVIALSTKEELKIFMSPQRQLLLREMELYGRPMTPKALSGKLGISASAATHHIIKLLELGIVEKDHTESINGIQAHFYRLTDVTVSIGQHFEDNLSGERSAIIQNLMLNTLKSYNSRIEYAKRNAIPYETMKDSGDFMSGVVHLTPEEGKNLMELIRCFLEQHSSPSSETRPWEYAFILFNSGEVQ